ncbi:MAG: Molybdopterin-guanine dinucleotide biosynthesis adapter protein [Candidatus Lokiarchaeum sp. GC14_75]|nr:MAG: Molybdopterin-guanine dinucleotide biosynthesis adapter protein [Candidatus Lokiarchaeum sp. GC14_75]
MIIIKIIDVIGYSGSGKTYFIRKLITLLKTKLGYRVAVVKNVKHHQIDKEGKDSYKFTESGASYSIIKNNNNDYGIFLNVNEDNLKKIVNWVHQGPIQIDILLTEGFRTLDHPTTLCVRNLDEIEQQLNKNVKLISGIICSKNINTNTFSNLPILDIEKNFFKFKDLFQI